jgi:transposase
VGVESRETAGAALVYAKEHLDIDPEIVVHDLSPNLLSAVGDCFGKDKSAIDPFHVMQGLNKAITKDIGRFQRRLFTNELNELKSLRVFISNCQKSINAGETLNPALSVIPACASDNKASIICRKITKEVFNLFSIENRPLFFQELRDLLLKLIISKNNLATLAFALAMEEKLPKKVSTLKSYKRCVNELLRKLKTLYLDSRRPIEREKIQFNRRRWVIYYQPEKLNPARAKIVLKFLQEYPELSAYRDLTLSIGSLYRLPLALVKNNLITDLPYNNGWGSDLKAIIKTIKRLFPAVLRFRGFFERNPDLPKRCRANMEYQNVKVKQVFRSGKYLKSIKRVCNELHLNIGGEVRNLLI